MIENQGKYYLYRHIRLDTEEPFYIGIGTKKDIKANTDRTTYHRAYNYSSRNTIWKNITNKTDYEIEIILESDDYEFIKQKEIEFIALYGRRDLNKGSLVNLTDGGEGATGYVQSKEQKEKRSQSSKNGNQIAKNRAKNLNTIFVTKQGYKVEVIEYFGANNCTVRFEDGFIVKEYPLHSLREGWLTHPNHAVIHGIGFIGDIKICNKKSYNVWCSMIGRYKEKIDKRWHNFQNFLKWYEKVWDSEYMDKSWQLQPLPLEEDKIFLNNTFLLPIELIAILRKSKGYYIGRNNTIYTSFRNKKAVRFNTKEEAVAHYKKIKKEYLIELIEKYKKYITDDAYNNLKNFKIKTYDL